MTSYTAPGNVQYNYAQLEGIWCQAGGTPSAAPIAAAIAMAESGGNTTATNQDSNGTVDRGLWQINSVHGAQSTYDVMGNARAAVAISNNGTSWNAWTTYTNGAYRQFVQVNTPADMRAPINATNAAANATELGYPGGALDPLNYLDPFGFFGKIFSLPQSAANQIDKSIATALQGMIISILNPFIQMTAGVLGIAAGGGMVLVGLWMIVGSTQSGQRLERGAGTAAQAGMSLYAPEVAGTTQYVGQPKAGTGERPVTTVTQHRRPAGQFRLGGRRITYRPAAVRTDVTRTGQRTYGDSYIAPGTRDQIRGESYQYTPRGRQPRP